MMKCILPPSLGSERNFHVRNIVKDKSKNLFQEDRSKGYFSSVIFVGLDYKTILNFYQFILVIQDLMLICWFFSLFLPLFRFKERKKVCCSHFFMTSPPSLDSVYSTTKSQCGLVRRNMALQCAAHDGVTKSQTTAPVITARFF